MAPSIRVEVERGETDESGRRVLADSCPKSVATSRQVRLHRVSHAGFSITYSRVGQFENRTFWL